MEGQDGREEAVDVPIAVQTQRTAVDGTPFPDIPTEEPTEGAKDSKKTLIAGN